MCERREQAWCECACVREQVSGVQASECERVSECLWASECVCVSEWVSECERVSVCEQASVSERAYVRVCACVCGVCGVCVCERFIFSHYWRAGKWTGTWVYLCLYERIPVIDAVPRRVELSMTSLTLRVSSAAYSCRSWLESSLKDVRLSCPRLSSCRNAWQQR